MVEKENTNQSDDVMRGRALGARPQAPSATNSVDAITALVEAIGYAQAQVAATCALGHDLTPPWPLLNAVAAVQAERRALLAENERLLAEVAKWREIGGPARTRAVAEVLAQECQPLVVALDNSDNTPTPGSR